ncbi:MAG: TetR/AcrR family transcriptional regulator [Pseudomonadota bacterium]
MLNTPIHELTRVAGLSNGTFYNHFDDRARLIQETASAIGLVLADEFAQRVSHIDQGIGRIVVSTQLFITLAGEKPAWGRILVEAAHSVSDMRFDFARNMLTDIERAIQQGAPLRVPESFRLFQIGTLIAVAIEAHIAGHAEASILRATCDAQLRLLGASPDQAEDAVTIYLKE